MKIPKVTVTKFRDKFRVTWWYDRQRFAIVFPVKSEATIAAAAIKLAIIGESPWPKDLLTRPAVQRFLNLGRTPIGTADAVKEYLHIVGPEIGSAWLIFTRACLNDLQEKHNLSEMKVVDAQKHMAEITASQSTSTRNKKLLVIKKFFNWAMEVYGWPENPFAGVKKLRQIKVNSDINYLSEKERDKVLTAADGCKYGLSVWIACYTGMRRGEVWNLCWENFNFDSETVIAQSKGGAVRTIPLAPALLERLKNDRKAAGRLFECGKYTVSARFLVERLTELCSDISKDCIGWNEFRHTFCSLLVQKGVSMDKVAMWAGHSIAVCRRHYARFAPKDSKDTDINKL